MADLRRSKNLAYEIGLYRVALVVNAVFDQMKIQPTSATLFEASETSDGENACLTYFWWVTLGGNKLSEPDLVIQRCSCMGIRSTLFKEWLAEFRKTAVPIIGAELADAWMLRAMHLAHEFPGTGDGNTVRRAQGSPG